MIQNKVHAIPVKGEDAAKYIEQAFADPIHHICRGILFRSLLSMDIRVNVPGKKRGREGEEVDPNAKLVEDFVNQYWKFCIVDIIFYGTVLGGFAYTLTEGETRVKDPKQKYVKKPFILPKTLYDVDIIITPDYNSYYGVKTTNPDLFSLNPAEQPSYDERLIYFPIPGYEPSKENGEYKSIVAASYQGSKWMQALEQSFVNANIQRSHPPIMIQESATGKAAESNLLQLEKLSTGLGTAQAEKADEDSTLQYKALQKAGTYFMNLGNQGKAIEDKKEEKIVTHFLPTPVDCIYPLPAGFEMANPQPPMPEPQPDLLNYDANRLRQVCALYGIPSSSIVSDAKAKGGTTTTATDDNDNLALQRTLHYWQRVISSFMTEVYLAIRKDLAGVPDAVFTVPIIPFTSTSKIHEFVDRNIIPTQIGKEMVAAIAGLSPDDILEGENEHLVPPIHGNENQTTPIIKAKYEVMMAEAAERKAKAKQAVQGEDISKGELELADKEKEFEEVQHEHKMELLDKQMEVEKIKADAAMKKATAQIKVNKSAPKPAAKKS